MIETGFYKCIRSYNRTRPQVSDFIQKNLVYILLEKNGKVYIFTKNKNVLKIILKPYEVKNWFKKVKK